MASTFTVHSFFYQNPSSLELLRSSLTQSSAAAPTSLFSLPPLPLEKPRLVSLRPPYIGIRLRGRRGLGGSVPCAIATPNSILTKDALKKLGDRGGGFSEEDELVDGDDYASGNGGSDGGNGADKDELAISRLGLPQRLVESLEKRGISHLFPIQRAVLVPALEG